MGPMPPRCAALPRSVSRSVRVGHFPLGHNFEDRLLHYEDITTCLRLVENLTRTFKASESTRPSSAMLVPNLATGGVCVCPSVRLSHAGNALKLMIIGSRGYRFRVARDSSFLTPIFCTIVVTCQENTLPRASKETAVGM